MILFWRVRYLDSRDKTFKDRDLYLETTTLSPARKAAVELCHELHNFKPDRKMLKYREHFVEKDYSTNEVAKLAELDGYGGVSFRSDYFEDETGKEITRNQIAAVLSGNPNVVSLHSGASQDDVGYILSEPKPIEIGKLTISAGDLESLAYFVRDLNELEGSALFAEGPGQLKGVMDAESSYHSAVSGEEISSVVTTFRRLYIEGEPHNFMKSVELFARVVGDYPLVKWVEGVANEHFAKRSMKPDFVPLIGHENWTFTRKRLIDVFIYTKYAHQPDERRTKQYAECLKQVGGSEQVLTWLFVCTVWHAVIDMLNAGRVIRKVYQAYCRQHGLAPKILDSVSKENPGIGTLEKKQQARQRLTTKKIEELAKALWEENGRPKGGFEQFLEQARKELD
jgi:hypothetical protein